jgi:RNA recognition motif-containing protein
MSKKLFVGNLPYSVNDQSLGGAFAAYSPASATVINDKFTGRSRGFGFVEIEDDAAATKAIEEMNGKEVDGRALVVNEARPREERPGN